jgi:hypothetical protein
MKSYEIKMPERLPKREGSGFLSDEEFEARYRWLFDYSRMNHGLRPTYREISDGWNISMTAVKGTIDRFVEKGWLVMVNSEGRQGGWIYGKEIDGFVDLSNLQLPKVSIVISTYNRPNSLRRLLNVIADQKHTNFDDIEVLISDDGSNAETRSAYAPINDRHWPFSLFHEYSPRREDGLPNLYRLKNETIKKAKNPLVWLLDDDLVVDDHTLFIVRSYHACLEETRPVLCAHTANVAEPQYYQMPFGIDAQPEDWDKLRVWSSFAGMSFWKRDWETVGGIDKRYNNAMGFADLDFGIELWKSGCQVMMIDGICVFVDDRETGSHRNGFIHTYREHHNGNLFMEKWGLEEAAKYGVSP